MTVASDTGWQRIETNELFVVAIADKTLLGDGMEFTIHSDGRITGTVDGLQLSGSWYWSEGYFCRFAELDGEDLGLDCEVIEQSGNQMRYTRQKGEGTSSIVDVEPN